MRWPTSVLLDYYRRIPAVEAERQLMAAQVTTLAHPGIKASTIRESMRRWQTIIASTKAMIAGPVKGVANNLRGWLRMMGVDTEG